MMNYNKDYWLFIEPYCFINIVQMPLKALIYNTINKSFIITENKKIVELCEKISKPDNLLVIKIKGVIIKEETIKKFIESFRANFMGDIIPVTDSKVKPIQISHQNYISQNLGTTKKERIKEFNKNKHLLISKLKRLSIYLNNKNELITKNNINYQFECLINEDDNYNEIDINNLTSLLILANENFQEINILGGSIFTYSKLNELLEALTTCNVNKTMFFNPLDVLKNKKRFMGIIKNGINANIDIPFNELNIFFNGDTKETLNNFNLINYRFIIENNNQLEQVEKIISKYSLDKYSLIPYYNGKNDNFFNENVIFNLEQLFEQKIDPNDIIENYHFNKNFYGKLIIFPNLDCYSNLNLKPLGNLKKSDITEIIYQEIKDVNIWTLTRQGVTPCKNCICNILCPPISDYEISLNKYNLCKIYSPN